MTGKERIKAALSFQKPDRVPVDFGASIDTGIVYEGYVPLAGEFGVNPAKSILINKMMRLVDVDEKILTALDIDTRLLHPGVPDSPQDVDLPGGGYRDMWGIERFPAGYYYDQKSFPLSGELSRNMIKNYSWPDPKDPGFCRPLRRRLEWIRANTDAAVVLQLPSPFVHISQYLRGFEDWYMDLAMETNEIGYLFDTVLDITTEIAIRILDEVGSDIDVTFCGDDLGTQDSLQFNPAHYRKFIRPRHEKYFRAVRSKTAAHIGFHTCGNVSSVLQDFPDIGINFYNPVQLSALGKGGIEVLSKLSGRLAVWGGMDTQRILPYETPEDVRREARRLSSIFSESGGFVLAASHNIQPDVPLNNILAMYDLKNRSNFDNKL